VSTRDDVAICDVMKEVWRVVGSVVVFDNNPACGIQIIATPSILKIPHKHFGFHFCFPLSVSVQSQVRSRQRHHQHSPRMPCIHPLSMSVKCKSMETGKHYSLAAKKISSRILRDQL